MKYVLILLLLIAHDSTAQKIRLSTYQYADNPRIKNIQPLADHLRSEYGFDVEVKSYPNIQAYVAAIQNNETDIALINSFGYLLLETSKRKFPMKPVLTLKVAANAKDNYKTAIVSKSAEKYSIINIKAAASRSRFAFVAVGSTSGNLVPRIALAMHGVNDPEAQFKQVHYAGTHRKALEAVLNDEADLAAFGHTELEKLDPNALKKINLVWLSPEIPLGPVLFNDGLSKEIQSKLLQAFLEIEKKDPSALGSVRSGWTEAKYAEHYMRIDKTYYNNFTRNFGSKEAVNKILVKFAN